MLLLLCGAVSGCFSQEGLPAWRYDEAERLVDDGARALREGRLTEALTAFELAREYAPVAAALDGKGCIAFLKGNLAEAEELFREAYESDATYDEALGNLALVLDVAGRDEEALELYRTLLEQHPEAARQRNNRAALAFDLGHGSSEVEGEFAKAALALAGGISEKNLERVRGSRRRSYGKASD